MKTIFSKVWVLQNGLSYGRLSISFPTPFYGCFHCVKSVQIRSFFWSVFSRIRTEYGEILRIYGQCSKHWTETHSFKWWHCLVQLLVIKDLSKSRSFFLLNLPKYLGRNFFIPSTRRLHVFYEKVSFQKKILKSLV